MIDFKVKKIPIPNTKPGQDRYTIVVAEFNGGYSHIDTDDNCWRVLNGGRPTRHIFPAALEVLKKLSNAPTDYQPLNYYLANSSEVLPYCRQWCTNWWEIRNSKENWYETGGPLCQQCKHRMYRELGNNCDNLDFEVDPGDKIG